MENFVGSMVSVHCGDVLGTYQGIVLQVDSDSQTLMLKEPFCNGLQAKVPTVTINASDIKDLKMLRSRDEAAGMPKVSSIHRPSKGCDMKTTTHKRPPSANETVVEVQAEPKSNHHQGGGRGWISPQKQVARNSPRRNKKEDCFSSPVESFANSEFDFEKNLALFDKQAVFAQIENAGGGPGGGPPNSRTPNKEHKYRCDENVLPSKPTVYRQIHMGEESGRVEYVTDAGLLVPSVSYELRCKLLADACKSGLTSDRQVEAVGRSAAEMVLQLLGGSHRLNPQNAHQYPQVAVLCGPHLQGAQAANCARHLAMHTVEVTAFLPRNLSPDAPAELTTEISLLGMTNAKLVNSAAELPDSSVDIIVSGLEGHNISHCDQPWYCPLSRWTAQKKAPVLAVDPPVSPLGANGTIHAKWGLSIALPLHGAHSTCAQMYLCDLSLPSQVYTRAGIRYTSPFGHKFVIPLHNRT